MGIEPVLSARPSPRTPWGPPWGPRLQAALAMEAAEVPCKAKEAWIFFHVPMENGKIWEHDQSMQIRIANMRKHP